MKIKTYKKIVFFVTLTLNLIWIATIVWSVHMLKLYDEAPPANGVVTELGETWAGGTWTYTVEYDWKGENDPEPKHYKAKMFYHLNIDKDDAMVVHINVDRPGHPYNTSPWKQLIVIGGFCIVLNLVILALKFKNANRGVRF